MLKKRIIFTLLYNDGSFMLSRNFRLQRVGDLKWLQKNYNFSNISFFIDELIILDVTRKERNLERFCEHIRALAEGCFVPIAAGGGICSVQQAKVLLRSGADKIVINSLLADNQKEIFSLASQFGHQCILASVDVKRIEENFVAFTHNGEKRQDKLLKEWLQTCVDLPTGEIYLNSIERDGTGHGYLMEMLAYLPSSTTVPVILAGGAGKPAHLAEGLKDSRVDAVATAHLFNFVGNGLKLARKELIELGHKLPIWDQ